MKDVIIDLEEKYQDTLLQVFKSKKLKKDLEKMEKVINDNYIDLTHKWQIENKVQLGFERILESNIYQEDFISDIYYSPMSADIAFYTKDAVIQIDAKTINCAPGTNPGDEKHVQFSRNQVSLKNKNVRANPSNGFEGIEYHAELPTIDKSTQLPVLTYFITLVYHDDGKLLELKRMNLVCVPNGIISKTMYNSDLIHNTKTYEYITKKTASKFKIQHWGKNIDPIKGKDNLVDMGNGFYKDCEAEHPFYPQSNVYRRKVDGEYKVILGVGTARINPEKIEKRKNSYGDNWLGVIRWDLNE